MKIYENYFRCKTFFLLVGIFVFGGVKKVDLGSLALFFFLKWKKKYIFTEEFSHFFEQKFWKKYFFLHFFYEIVFFFFT